MPYNLIYICVRKLKAYLGTFGCRRRVSKRKKKRVLQLLDGFEPRCLSSCLKIVWGHLRSTRRPAGSCSGGRGLRGTGPTRPRGQLKREGRPDLASLPRGMGRGRFLLLIKR